MGDIVMLRDYPLIAWAVVAPDGGLYDDVGFLSLYWDEENARAAAMEGSEVRQVRVVLEPVEGRS